MAMAKSRGFGETLQAVGGHQFADVLAEPGEDDLSAHVDFAALAEAARHGGAAFMVRAARASSWPIWASPARAEQLMKANPGAAQSLLHGGGAADRPDQMGNLFKALAFLPPSAATPPGFSDNR